MITRRSLLALSSGFAARNLLLAAEALPDLPTSIAPAGPITEFRVTSPLVVGRRVKLESITDWTPLLAAYGGIQGRSGPDSLTAQRALHFFYSDQMLTDVHNSYTLFLWHRWFLYFHERLLQRYGAGSGFLLPYWDGSLSANYPLPHVLLSARQLEPIGPATCDSAPQPTQMRDLLNQLDQRQTFEGAFQAITAWHTEVHSSVGYLNHRSCQMQDQPTAGGDPVLYFFHSQIDRLFEWWMRNPHQPQDPSPLDVRYTFLDFPPGTDAVNKVCVRLGDALNLKYTYDATPQRYPGSFLPPNQRGQRTAWVLEMRSALLHPGVKRYRVEVSRGRARALAGEFCMCGHIHGTEWRGIAVYEIPRQMASPDSTVILVPTQGGDAVPIPLTGERYRFGIREVY